MSAHEGTSQALVIDDESFSRALHEQMAERPQRSSPLRRSAAYHSDIELVGRSQAFIEVMKQVDRVANTDLPVFLTGESGTGKELLASVIHHHSVRCDRPFIAVNCGAIPADMIEAELFGYVSGSFTGADEDRRGLLEEADGGTVFLNQITETNSSFQIKLLRALQTGEIQAVGSNETKKVNVRVIAATHRNAEPNDLFYLLNAVSIVLPPAATPEPAADDWVTLSEIEGRYVARVLEHTGGNKQAAARILDVDRKTLDRMIKRHHINVPHFRGHHVKTAGHDKFVTHKT
jgi:DNA-binding NtrC family response regulator